jgi:GNAT superfamily N-acetyltransferase
MAELIAIRSMRPSDLARADRLREQVGWNQTLVDWQHVLSWEPEGCFVAEHDEQIVGTVTTTVFGPELAWVGMMLIDQAVRRQGLGRRLLEHALAWLEDKRQVRCVGLDATPQGKLLYDRMGFADAYTLHRRHGVAACLTAAAEVRPLNGSDLTPVVELDRSALGVDRARLVQDLHAGHTAGSFVFERGGEILGYVLSRPGANRWYVGPMVAREASVAEALANAAMAPLAGQPVVMDTVDTNDAATGLAEKLGLAEVRPFIRMWRGEPLPPAEPSRVCFGIIGPEVG